MTKNLAQRRTPQKPPAAETTRLRVVRGDDHLKLQRDDLFDVNLSTGKIVLTRELLYHPRHLRWLLDSGQLVPADQQSIERAA